MKKRKPRQSRTTVRQLVDCINQRYRKHRSAIANEDNAYGDFFLDLKEKVRTQGDLWGRVFEDRRIECSLGTAEKYMSIARNSVMRNSAHAQIWPRSFYVRYLLSTLPESRLQELVDAGRIIHPKLTRKEVEALVAQQRTRPRLVSFGRSINGGMGRDLWHNNPEKVFGARTIGRKLAPGAHLFAFAQRHLRSPVDVVKAILTLSTLLPNERHWPGDGHPKKWDLLLCSVFEHDKVETCLQHLSQTPIDKHEAYVERLMREAYAAHKAEGEGTQTPEADSEAA
jgi:hypothetical protein